ncbi:MAG: histidine kinase N-terminal 7TM domain-containing protein [Candidatus Moraniibacteriota bacterium]
MVHYILQIVHFISFVVYLSFFFYVILKDRTSWLNRIFSLILLCFSLWSFSYIFIHDINSTKNVVALFINIKSIGWICIPLLFLIFTIIYSEKKEILNKAYFYLLSLIFPVVLTYKQWTSGFIGNFQKTYYGWSYEWPSSFWTYTFMIYYFLFFGISFYLLFGCYKKAISLIKKKQIMVLFIFSLISLVIGLFTDIILKILHIHSFPPLTDSFSFLWIGGIIYAIYKYQLLDINTGIAMEAIFSNISESLIITSIKGEIIKFNKATENLFGYTEKELKNKFIGIIFSDINFKKNFSSIIKKSELLEEEVTILKNKKKEKIRALLSISYVKNRIGEKLGIIFQIKDISEKTKTEEELKKQLIEQEKLNKFLVGREVKMIELKKKIAELEKK